MLRVCLILWIGVEVLTVGNRFVGEFRLAKLIGLSSEQLAVLAKYACVECRFFGFSCVNHYFCCELECFPFGGARVARRCEHFVVNERLLVR